MLEGTRTRDGTARDKGVTPRQGTGATSSTHILPLGADVTLGSPDATATLEQEGTMSVSCCRRGQSWDRAEMPLEGKRGHWHWEGVTYQLSLVTRVPRWSLGAFPALEEREKHGLSREKWDPAAPMGGGHPPAARLLRCSPPCPCSQQDPAKRAWRGRFPSQAVPGNAQGGIQSPGPTARVALTVSPLGPAMPGYPLRP